MHWWCFDLYVISGLQGDIAIVNPLLLEKVVNAYNETWIYNTAFAIILDRIITKRITSGKANVDAHFLSLNLERLNLKWTKNDFLLINVP